jgi:tetratricopeptide (TPR) repeat protein
VKASKVPFGVSARENRKWTPVVFAVFVIVFGSLSIGNFTQQSPTIDEPVHLLGGYSYLKWHDFRVNPEHPPLVKMWAALPLLWMEVHDPREENSLWRQILESEPGGPVYVFAREMFFRHNDAAKLFFFARLQMLAISVLLAWFIFLWSRELFGICAAMSSLALYALEPTILAHSAIIHTDLPFAAVFFIGTYFLWRVARQWTWSNLLLASFACGFAAMTKHSFLVFGPVWLALGIVEGCGSGPRAEPTEAAWFRKNSLHRMATVFACAAGAAYFALWAAYGFRFRAASEETALLFVADVLPAHRAIVQAFVSFLLDYRLLPEAFIAGCLYNFKVWGRSSYLLGALSADGFWSYFPVAFAVKTPVPFLLMLAAVLGLIVLKKRSRIYLWLIVPPLIYLVLAILSRFNIGIRHLLPIYPFLFVLTGGFVAEMWREGARWKRGIFIALGSWFLWSSLSIYPDYLAYFNELVGGPKNGHKVLLDSNLDWGQDLVGLKKWMDAQGVKKIQLLYFGTAEPEYYGIDDFYSAENLFGKGTTARREIDLPEYLAISANFLYGGKLFLPDDMAKLAASYRPEQPVGGIGYSIYVFRLNLSDSRVYENAAFLAARKGASGMAASLLEKALQINPESADAHRALAQIFKQQGKLEEAARHYREALRILKSGGEKTGRNQ